jgi:hypothetical protein
MARALISTYQRINGVTYEKITLLRDKVTSHQSLVAGQNKNKKIFFYLLFKLTLKISPGNLFCFSSSSFDAFRIQSNAGGFVVRP